LREHYRIEREPQLPVRSNITYFLYTHEKSDNAFLTNLGETGMTSMKIEQLFSVTDKVVLVTGGGRGIGRMIAQGFVENGARVYISSRKIDDLSSTVDELSPLGFCEFIQADLASTQGRQTLIDAIAEKENRLDVLVNNAGFGWVEPLDEFSEAGYDKVMDINVKALFFLTQGFLPLLEKSGSPTQRASIINVGSTEGNKITEQLNFNYGASKAAVHYLTRKFAFHLADRNIRVNAIAPGRFESRMQLELETAEGRELATESVPLKRIGEPSDMVAIAIYFASAASENVTGEVTTVDSGFHLL
jgi:NAD(P)-dependent dehydrogenase (short-subunit alcohol dehydrogenase family)